MIMKLTKGSLTKIFVGIALGLAIGCWVGYEHGRSIGYRRAATLQRKSIFISSFGALESLRSGDVLSAIERLEAMNYSTAVSMLEDRDSASNPVLSTFKDSLVAYRETYAHPPPQQYATERRLDELLGIGRSTTNRLQPKNVTGSTR